MDADSGTELDYHVRRFVYDEILSAGQIPTVAATAVALQRDPSAVRDAFRRLAAGRVVVLQEDDEILMANPFSAVPTPFVVTSGQRSWWANCMWDALGIAAVVQGDSTVRTSCADCGSAMQVEIAAGRLARAEGLVHFAVPARRWWENIVFA